MKIDDEQIREHRAEDGTEYGTDLEIIENDRIWISLKKFQDENFQ